MTSIVAERPRPAETLNRRRLLARADALLTGKRLLLAVASVYLLYGLFVTWPLATNLSGQLSAPNMFEDAAGSTAYFSYLVAHHLTPFLPAHLSGLNAPYGTVNPWALNLAQAPSYLLFWLPILLFGPVAGSNLFMLLGFVMSGTTMFAIIRRLFGSRAVALLAGFAFAFYPFAVAASSVHYVFVHGWPLLLCVWALIEMVHEPTRRRAWIAGLATAFAMWWNPYYELLGGFAFATCVVLCVGVGRARGQTRQAVRTAAVAVVPVVALGICFLILLRAGGGLSTAGSVARPISQVYAFSARLREYLLPGPYNPLVGHLTGPYLQARLGIDDVWDSALYPGYLVIALAIAGFVAAVRRLRADRTVLADRRVVAVLVAAALALVAFISSAPPTISVLGLTIRMPSDLLFHITPTWQTFARFVILLELALIIMMSAVLAQLRRSLPAQRVAVVFALIGLLLMADLWAREPKRTVSTAPPKAYGWLRNHQGGTVADYPILPAYAPANASTLFWGAYDRHPLFQGFAPLTTIESMKLDLADLRGSQTAAKLASYGVRYIVVHRGARGNSPAQLRARGYRPIVVDRHGASLWQVTSKPPTTSVDARSGFNWASGYPTYDTRLLEGSGVLALHAQGCSSCTGTASFFIRGANRAIQLTVIDQRTGAVLARVAAPIKHSVRVTVPGATLRDGAGELELRTSPSGADAVVGLGTARLTLQHR